MEFLNAFLVECFLFFECFIARGLFFSLLFYTVSFADRQIEYRTFEALSWLLTVRHCNFSARSGLLIRLFGSDVKPYGTIMIYYGSGSDLRKVSVPVPKPKPDQDLTWLFSTFKKLCTKSCHSTVRSSNVSHRVCLSVLIFKNFLLSYFILCWIRIQIRNDCIPVP